MPPSAPLRLPLPLAGEGWGGGLSASHTASLGRAFPPPGPHLAMRSTSPASGRGSPDDAALSDALARSQRFHLHPGGRRPRRADPAVQPAAAGGLDVPGADLSGRAVRQIRLLRHSRALDRPDLGLLRHSLARPRRVLRARRLRDGHVPDAPDRQPRRLRQSDPARLHGVPELSEPAMVLVRLRHVLVRGADGAGGAGPAGVLLRLAGVSFARHRRLSLDHHAGDDLRAAAGVLPQRFRLWRQ